jgi:hypothetical protein
LFEYCTKNAIFKAIEIKLIKVVNRLDTSCFDGTRYRFFDCRIGNGRVLFVIAGPVVEKEKDDDGHD